MLNLLMDWMCCMMDDDEMWYHHSNFSRNNYYKILIASTNKSQIQLRQFQKPELKNIASFQAGIVKRIFILPKRTLRKDVPLPPATTRHKPFKTPLVVIKRVLSDKLDDQRVNAIPDRISLRIRTNGCFYACSLLFLSFALIAWGLSASEYFRRVNYWDVLADVCFLVNRFTWFLWFSVTSMNYLLCIMVICSIMFCLLFNVLFFTYFNLYQVHMPTRWFGNRFQSIDMSYWLYFVNGNGYI